MMYLLLATMSQKWVKRPRLKVPLVEAGHGKYMVLFEKRDGKNVVVREIYKKDSK